VKAWLPIEITESGIVISSIPLPQNIPYLISVIDSESLTSFNARLSMNVDVPPFSIESGKITEVNEYCFWNTALTSPYVFGSISGAAPTISLGTLTNHWLYDGPAKEYSYSPILLNIRLGHPQKQSTPILVTLSGMFTSPISPVS
jgi:hypothetical protein